MKATEHEMTLAVDAVARAAWGNFNPAHATPNPPFDDLPANVQMNLRQGVAKVAVAAIEAIPDRVPAAEAALRERIAADLEAMGEVWGGGEAWLTTGTKVGQLSAAVARADQ